MIWIFSPYGPAAPWRWVWVVLDLSFAPAIWGGFMSASKVEPQFRDPNLWLRHSFYTWLILLAVGALIARLTYLTVP
jgi:hypothetical protein